MGPGALPVEVEGVAEVVEVRAAYASASVAQSLFSLPKPVVLVAAPP